jgi:hypothetical protein
MITLAERKKIARLVLTTSDDRILAKIKELINPELGLKKVYPQKYNEEIDQGVAEIKAGKYLTQQEADNLLRKWESE